MERLTVRCADDTGLCGYARNTCDEICYKFETCEDGCPIQKAFNKLAEYEETGLTPDQIKAIDVLYAKKCKEVAALEKAMQERWIPITWHETTEEDGFDVKRYPLCLDCEMPEDGQEIIICRKNGWVCTDTCWFDDGYSLDSGCDWIEEVIAWMPLPEAYKEVQDA